MNYISTRNKNINCSASFAIKQGLNTDGGLFWPETFPAVSLADIEQLSKMDYRGRAKYILGKYLTDFANEEISRCVDKAYTTDKFDSEDIAPVRKIRDGAYTLELWHGPTCAFKDMALQILPHLMTTSIRKTGENREVVILTATSGDTGKAALEGFCDVENTNVIVFFPNDGVSNIQRKQMISQQGNNTFVTAVEGNFDDCQTAVKKIFADRAVSDVLAENGFVFSSANSINWGRLVPQAVYYFSAYCDLLKRREVTLGEKIDFVVPTGNFGDILAGYIAKEMGLPVHKLVCASNKNNILTDFIHTGKYDVKRPFYTTMSPSMDILVSSNLERLLFALSGDDKLISQYMNSLNSDGEYTASEAILKQLQQQFVAGFTDEDDTTATIRKYFDNYGYLVDPHTAVALNVFEQTESSYKSVILSTASPYKFPESVSSALKISKSFDNEWTLLEKIQEASGMPIPDSLHSLQNKPDRFTGVCRKDKMTESILKFLKIQG